MARGDSLGDPVNDAYGTGRQPLATTEHHVVKRVELHTDGACLGNPGPGGWAALLRYGARERELVGGEVHSTNNRMELMAAIAALEALNEDCAVLLYTDSQYLRQGITEWMPNWIQRGWKTTAGGPVKNRDLWERLHTATRRHQIDWRWVKGHFGDPDNERVDQLARDQALRLKQGLMDQPGGSARGG